jgi:hypothetical protein
LQGLLPLLRKKDTKKVVFMSSAMGSSTITASIIGRVLKGEPKPITEDFFEMNTYCTEKSALTMQALVSGMGNILSRLANNVYNRDGMQLCTLRDSLSSQSTPAGELNIL